MRSFPVPVLAHLLLAVCAGAQDLSIELDGDNILGNGPDTLIVSPFSSVPIDVHVTGLSVIVISANFTLSHSGPATWNPYSHATGWTTQPDQHYGGNDWLIQATDFAFQGLYPPFLHGTAHYTFDGPVGLVTVSIVEPTGWLGSQFITNYFVNNIGLTFGIDSEDPPTATEESSWGAVKQLFR